MANVFDQQAALLKIYVEETACKDGQKAAEWIACRACEMGMAGASVFRGIGGYFANAPIVAPEWMMILLPSRQWRRIDTFGWIRQFSPICTNSPT